MHPALRHPVGKRGDGLQHAAAGPRRFQLHGKHPRRLSAHAHQQFGAGGARRSSQKRDHADLRRVRHHAAGGQADPRAGHVSFHFRIHRQGRRDRTGNEPRTVGHFQHLFRSALHGSASVGLRQPAGRENRQAQGQLLAGQHRLDGRTLRRRQPDGDRAYPRHDQRHSERRLEKSETENRPDFRFPGSRVLPQRAG